MGKITSANNMLQQHITSLKHSNEDLIKNCEENEKYRKRLCLSINGVSRKRRENWESVRLGKKVILGSRSYDSRCIVGQSLPCQ